MTYRRPTAVAITLCLALGEARSLAQQGASAPAAPSTSAAGAGALGGAQLTSATGPYSVQGQPAIAGAQPAIGPVQPPAPPFQLSQEEYQYVFQTLQMWEQTSSKVETFTADFERWKYDAVFAPGLDGPMIKSTGNLSFSKPDKGRFKIDTINRWTKKDPQSTAPGAPGDWVPQPNEIGEHWVCDGKAVYEYDHREKQLKVTPIPEEMRGKSIVDGPLPFLFGAEAQKLMDRYWVRAKQSTESEIWLEAYPKWQADAANYDRVDVMLDLKTMQPKAIQVHLPGGQQRDVYMFQDVKVNEKNLGTLFNSLFSAPRTPPFWTKVVTEQPPLGPQAANTTGGVQR